MLTFKIVPFSVDLYSKLTSITISVFLLCQWHPWAYTVYIYTFIFIFFYLLLTLVSSARCYALFLSPYLFSNQIIVYHWEHCFWQNTRVLFASVDFIIHCFPARFCLLRPFFFYLIYLFIAISTFQIILWIV